MATLGDLFQKFASSSGEEPTTPTTTNAVAGNGHNKLASEGENHMNSLQDIYLAISGQDQEKTAAAAAYVPQQDDIADGGDVDFAKMAEHLAEQEADLEVQSDGETDYVKVAAEYDSAGRIMARGFFDEFLKLAEGTTAADNQNTESESASKMPALGERGLPTLETNYAGTVSASSPGQQPQMNGPGPKQVYSDSMSPSKMINAGQGTGEDPEAAAIGLGGGAPVGFATVRDLQA